MAQVDAVREVLAEIGAERVPELLCFNKADRTTEAKRFVDRHAGSVAISARTGDGVEDLLLAIGDRLRTLTTVVELLVPWARGDVLAEVHREGEVLDEAAEDDGMRIRARLDEAASAKLAAWAAG
jgi:GTP-binding protein HflX